jgi:hypothetical protein
MSIPTTTLGAELASLRLRLLRDTTVTQENAGPGGAAPPTSAASPSPVIPISRARARRKGCSCPCSVELPDEIA